MLPARMLEPADFTWGEFTNAEGARIRYGSLQPQGTPKGTIVLAQGFQETIEMYFETMRDFTARGYAVWALDWHGQGGSERFLADKQKMHNNGYEEHIATLDQFAKDIVKKSAGPLILHGHSMGGHISMRYLKEHEGVFDSAILSSPMVDIQTPGFPKCIAKAFAKGGAAVGAEDQYVPGEMHDWDEKKERKDTLKRMTSDPVRASMLAEIYAQKPKLKMGGPTFGWLSNTFNTVAILKPDDYLKSIKTPVLMLRAGDEHVVDKGAQERAAALMQNTRQVYISEAKHDLWRENDKVRHEYLKHIDKFLAEGLSIHGRTQSSLAKFTPVNFGL